MPYMVVTLEVSKFSGWLNDEADCRVRSSARRGEAKGEGQTAGHRSA